MSEPIVHLDHVSRIYTRGALTVTAVDDLSLTIAPGEFTVVCGPSGSGKTTVLNLIGGLDEPTSGRIILEGRDTAQLGRAALARVRRDRIGFVFQAYNLIDALTAYENAELVLAMQKVPISERRPRVEKILEDVGLAGLGDRRPDQLSGGQQQRVAIARAIAARPAIVLADEPTANVDSHTAESLLDLMQSLNREHGATFLFSTHDEKVMRRAKRVVRLVDGKIEDDERREH